MVDMKIASFDEVIIYPLSHYATVEREAQPEEDTSVPTRVSRLETQYAETGIRRSVDAVMVVLHHGVPHVLTLQVANAFYKLPGGYLDSSETDAEGLITRLNEQLGIPKDHAGQLCGPENPNAAYHMNPSGDWIVKECLSSWWRPNFDTFLYPYLPAHIVEPKEIKRLYLVELPFQKVFAIPQNMSMRAIPIHEFYDNASRYGPQFAGLPYLLSKYWLPGHGKAFKAATEHSVFKQQEPSFT
ncbi:Cleavage/polyadenylation specificity factor subunit 5 [Kockovaella imperatae]|uniref:Cleavage and polyadenylation specificity factor subunit 5 n=1 Tax=Kockovaella imperatae TaxID=4999 RepID=A0A1Y1UJT1_9TREE|nr:Cleavage/polyadenylation specificity factor subunit 5 [Kockovaella imperatae]ORX38320.1 Cleavage/polyadenylation specificity factor subunit 5 [Kockovaella imperatae]